MWRSIFCFYTDWYLEKKHSEQPLLAALDYTFPYVEGVRKGKWMIEGEKLCRRNGIKPEYY